MGEVLKLLVLSVAMSATQAWAQSGVVSGPPQVKIEPVWIAVAGGFDGNGRNVGVGYSGHQNSRDAAENAALVSCRKYGRGVRCREAHAVNAGCLYIVPGSRQGGVTWGRGTTREVALTECRRGGYRCNSDRVIGGCASGSGN
jgi:hypothetical protein